MNNKKKNTKRNLVSSIISLVLCVAMLMGTTFAWFTDSASTGVNKIQAGNLDVELYHSNKSVVDEKVTTSTILFNDITLWEPGVVAYEKLKVSNEGNLALKYKLAISPLVKNVDYNFIVEASGVNTERSLLDVLYVYTNTSGALDEITARSLTASDGVKLKEFLNSAQNLLSGNLLSNGVSDTVDVAIYWPQSLIDNDYNVNNGRSVTALDGNAQTALQVKFPVTLVATQLTNESDSFDNQYDRDATYPLLAPVINSSNTKNVDIANGTVIDTPVAKSTITDTAQITSAQKTDGSSALLTNHSMTAGSSLTRKIETTESTSDSVTYDISYIYTETSGESTSSYNVSEFSDVVENIIYLSSGLKDVKVTHSHGDEVTVMHKLDNMPTNIVDNTYYYKPETGELYVWSKKYSKFAVSYTSDFVAVVDGQGYYTIQEAVDHAENGQTIAVLKDVRSNEPIFEVADKTIIVDLNKHTIDYYENLTNNFMYAIGVNGTANLTITNGTINTEAEKSDGICVDGERAVLNVDNVTFNVCEVGVRSYGTGNCISINNSEIHSNYWGVYQEGSNGGNTIKVSNTTIIDACEDGSGIYISNNSSNEMQTLIVENSNVGGATSIEVKHTNASITGSTLAATGNPTEFEENNNGSTAIGYCFAVTSNTTGSAIDVTRGTIAFSDVVFEPVVPGCDVFNSSASKGINGGAVINGYDNTHVLSPDKLLPDCSVKESKKIYYSLLDLKSETATNLKGKTIILNNDVVLNNELYLSGKNFTLDLNGHSISLEYGTDVEKNNYSTIYVAGKNSNLTIIDSSPENTGSVYGPELTVSGKAPCAVRIGNYGKLNIKGGNYYGLGDSNPAIFTHTSIASSTAASVKIYGGKFMTQSPSNGIYYVLNHQDSLTTNCKMTIYGGTFVNYEPGVTPVDAVNVKTGKIAVASGYKTISETHEADTWYTVVPEKS